MRFTILLLLFTATFVVAGCSSCPLAERERDHAWESWQYDHKLVVADDEFEAEQTRLKDDADGLASYRATHMPDALYQMRLFARDEAQKRSAEGE